MRWRENDWEMDKNRAAKQEWKREESRDYSSRSIENFPPPSPGMGAVPHVEARLGGTDKLGTTRILVTL